MKTILIFFALGFNYFVGFYYGAVNIFYTVLLAIALGVILRHVRRIKYEPFKEYSVSPQTPSVSILIPAHNEDKVIVRTIRSALAVDYPIFEVIVINDGSVDGTLEAVVNAFGLKKIDLVYRNLLRTRPVKAFYSNPEIPNLVVIDKERSGKADSLNCAITVSRSPYFCSVDADSLLDIAKLRFWNYKEIDIYNSGCDQKNSIRLNIASGLAGIKSENETLLKSQGYVLLIANDAITLRYENKAGFINGITSIKQLLIKDGDHFKLPCCEITDWPSLPVRAIAPTFSWYAGYGRIGFDCQLWGYDEWVEFLNINLDNKINQFNN